MARHRIGQVAVFCAVFGLLALLIGKAILDWRLRQTDETLKLSSAKLQELLDHAYASQAQARQLREYPLSDDLVTALSNPSGFGVYHTVADVPESVRIAFAKVANEENFLMADPGGRWEPTDIIRDARLPRRRLSSVAIRADLCLLFYEHGGIQKNDNVAVFRIFGDRAEAIWHAYVAHVVRSPAALIKALQEQHYREAPFF